MNVSFQITSATTQDFFGHWSETYRYANEDKYLRNIGKSLTEQSRLELFEWKNGSSISAAKRVSIESNYPLVFPEDARARYLDHQKPGGAIWNIFYLHCIDHERWPIFDQHTYRAMHFMLTGKIVEIGLTSKQKYASYLNEYIPFISRFSSAGGRKVDKALFSFGQFLKLAKPYTCGACALTHQICYL